MRVRSAVVLAALLVAVGAGCTGDDDGQAETARDTGAAADTVTTEPTTAAGELGQICRNAVSEFSVRYPDGWHTNATDDLEPCRFFHPEPFELPERTEAVGLAVSFEVAAQAFDRLVAGVREGPAQEIQSEEELTVGGRQALRVESRSTGEALLREGTPVLTFYVDLDGRTLVASTAGTSGLDFERNGEVLEQMVRSLMVPL